MKTVQTKKGTTLPLISLKGKDYLQVAYRVQWFTEEVPAFHISTQFLTMTDTEAICQVTVIVLNEQGQALRKAVGTKKETKADFNDFIEKAETGALGRALIQLGYGTQYALADLDEGTRIVDSPLVDTKQAAPTTAQKTEAPAAKVSSFRKKKEEVAREVSKDPVVTTPPSNGTKKDEWL